MVLSLLLTPALVLHNHRIWSSGKCVEAGPDFNELTTAGKC